MSRAMIGTPKVGSPRVGVPRGSIGRGGLGVFAAGFAAKMAQPGIVKLLCIGNSETAGWGGSAIAAQLSSANSSWPMRLAQKFRGAQEASIFGDRNTLIGSPGTVTLAAFDPRVVLGSWTQATANLKTLGGPMLTCTAGTTALTFTPARKVTTFDIYTRTAAGLGSMNASIDAGGTTLIDQNAASGVVKTTLVVASDYHTLNIARVAGNCDLLGINAYDATNDKISVINAGWSGSLVADWVASTPAAYDPLNMIDTLVPSATIVVLTANDWNANTLVATYKANLQTLVQKAKPYGPVLVVSGPPTAIATTTAAQQLGIINGARDVAAANGCQFLNITEKWGSYEIKQPLGFYFDTLHPQSAGYASEADYIAACVHAPLRAPSANGLIASLPLNNVDFDFVGNFVAELSGAALPTRLTNLAAPALLNPGITFDGVTDAHIDLPNSIFDHLKQGTVMAYINLANLVPNATAWAVFGGGSSSAVTALFALAVFGNTGADTRLRLHANNNTDVLMGDTSITAAAWHHVAAVSDGLVSSLVVDFVPQTLVASGGSNTGKWINSSLQGTMRYRLGVLPRSSGDIFLFKGGIRGGKVFDRPLSLAEIIANA